MTREYEDSCVSANESARDEQQSSVDSQDLTAEGALNQRDALLREQTASLSRTLCRRLQ